MKQIFLFLSCLLLIHEGIAQEYRSLTTAEFFQEIEEDADSKLVINFWATWCGPCVKELPVFNDLAEVHPNARFIFVSLDMRTEALEAFIEANEFS
ncbi:MAG: TlpA family protein disulfide reductase, partial [Bacteroidota bacterium]